MGDIRSGFTKGKFSDGSDFQITKVQKVKLDNAVPNDGPQSNTEHSPETMEDPVEFTRNTPQRGSGKKVSMVSSKLKAIEESKTQMDSQTSDERYSKKSGENKDDLFDYLLQSGDDSEKHLFERQGSLRRRRRNRSNNVDIKTDRERASSPNVTEVVDVQVGHSKSPQSHSPISESPLVTSELQKSKPEDDPTDLKRWSSSSSETHSDRAEESIADYKQRRLERRRRSNLEKTEFDKIMTQKEETARPEVVIPSAVTLPSQPPAQNANLDLTDKASRQYLIDRAKARFNLQSNEPSFVTPGTDILNPQTTLDRIRSYQRSQSAVESHGIEKYLRNRETNNNEPLKDISDRYRHRNTDVDEAIEHVQKTGREMESILDADKEDTEISNTKAALAKYRYLLDPDARKKSNTSRYRVRDRESITELAWIQHVKDTERQRSNIDKADVDEAFRNAKEESLSRPYSTYDNMPDLNPTLSNTSSGDVSSHSSSNASISTNDSTDTLICSEPPLSTTMTPRYARITGRVSTENGETKTSPFKRSATLPRRWRSNYSPHRQEQGIIKEEDNKTTLRSHKLLNNREQSVEPTTQVRNNRESRELDSNIQEFQNRLPANEKARMQSRFKALSQRYASEDDPLWKPSLEGQSDILKNESRERPINNDVSHHPTAITTHVTSPRSLRSNEDIKGDSDSVASSKDEGFESECVSDPNASQRTSMSSTLEQELHKPEDEHSGDKLFARSFDSLVKNDFVTTEINIEEPTVVGGDKTPTSIDSRSLEVWQSGDERQNRTITNTPENELKKLPGSDTIADLPPTPPERTTSKSKQTMSKTSRVSTKSPSPSKTSVFSRLTKTNADVRSPNTTRRSSNASSGSSTPKGSRRSTQSTMKDTASAVTARLTASRPRKPSGMLIRHPSNSSLASESSTSGTIPRAKHSAKSPKATASKSPAMSRSPKSNSKGNSTDDLAGNSSPSTFVRGIGVRATMPASVLRNNKKMASDHHKSSDVPTPPKRTTSIRATTERLAKPSSPSHTLKPTLVEGKEPSASTPGRTRRVMTKPSGTTVSKTSNSPVKQNGHADAVQSETSPKTDDKKTNVFQRLMAKPSRRSVTPASSDNKKSKAGIKTTTESSKC